jgi:hypothetical protein
LATLVIRNTSPPPVGAIVDRNVRLRGVPDDCRVYAFVFRQSKLDSRIKGELEAIGEEAGLNLFVGLWDMSDPNYIKMNEIFSLGKLPAVIMTADSSLSTVSDTENTFVRIDDERLLEKPEEFSVLINQLYNLFLRGDITNAIKKTHSAEISVFLSNFLKEIKTSIGDVASKIIETYNIKFEIGPFKAELTKPAAA